MRRKKEYERVRGELSGIYPPEEARAMALALFGHFYGLSLTDLFLDPEAETDPVPEFDRALEQLKNHRPLQYVLGETEFCGLRLKVDERVLIPRPETEELVRWIAGEWQNRTPRILDIGTGSGALAIALAKNLAPAGVTGVDISDGALDVARENARANGVSVDFLTCDILREVPPGKYEVIVGNPPYVRESEKLEMQPNVLAYEPAEALFVPDGDPLLFYRRIARIAPGLLTGGGALYFEINEAFGPDVADLLTAAGFHDVELRKDLSGRDRMTRCVWR